jgi:asparagine synthase (glutamine-hydrolysing)
MCGIAGFAGSGTQQDLQGMTDVLLHRGPDGAGYFCDEEAKVYLGHRRLSIIDVAGGAQPMWNEDRSVGIVFNGEIYNHRELRDILRAKGHVFATDHSDTEVLVHGYEEWGHKLLDRLSGMFAFAIYDLAKRRLFLARDRFGKKPLFYVKTPNLFGFASELPALLRHPAVPSGIDVGAIRKFFAYNFFPSPLSPYLAIRSLPAGHYAEYDLQSDTLQMQRYWKFRIEPEEPNRSDDEVAEELRELLAAAVKRRLESDVPLGILLSGGVDSSAILALAARDVPSEHLNTFALGFREASFDESEFARLMADHVGSRHHAIKMSIEDVKLGIDDLLTRLSEPIGDSSVLPTYLVSHFARQQVTVALGGDGGDELFAGYDPIRALRASRLYRSIVPNALHPAIRAIAARLPVSDNNMSLDFKINRWLRGLGSRPALWNPLWMSPLEPNEISELFRQPISAEELYSEAISLWDESGSTNDIDRTLEFFTTMYLSDDILVKVDRAAMLTSLEVRSPFLDNNVAEFARRLPNRFKFRDGKSKYILKRALAGLVPQEILNRSKKGFGIPLAKWLRELPPPTGKLDFLDTKWLSGRWDRHATHRQDCRLGLWCWLVLDQSLAHAASR